jgi:riboflavin transporter FmnP
LAFVAADILAITLRVVVALIFNFYFALPVFFNMSVDAILSFFSSAPNFFGISLGLVGLGAFVGEVAF